MQVDTRVALGHMSHRHGYQFLDLGGQMPGLVHRLLEVQELLEQLRLQFPELANALGIYPVARISHAPLPPLFTVAVNLLTLRRLANLPLIGLRRGRPPSIEADAARL